MRVFIISFFIACAIGIIVFRLPLIFSKNLDIFGKDPLPMAFRFAAEAILAILLILTGVSIILKKKWEMELVFLSSGFLMTSAISSAFHYYSFYQNKFFMVLSIIAAVVTFAVCFYMFLAYTYGFDKSYIALRESKALLLFSMGIILYVLIMSAGVFAGRKEWVLLSVLSAGMIIWIVSTIRMFKLI
ncbi:hypothetical protein ACFL20_05145 [Spirochaetota bacterium]